MYQYIDDTYTIDSLKLSFEMKRGLEMQKKNNIKPIVVPGPNLELRTGIEKLLIIITREFR